jgi:hypothetical protein
MDPTNALADPIEYGVNIAGNTRFLNDINGRFPSVDYKLVAIELLHTLTGQPRKEIEERLERESTEKYVETVKRRQPIILFKNGNVE